MNKFLLSLFVLCSTGWALSVSVKQYGAKGDGHADDTAAIVKASHAVAKAGGSLEFPSGVYMIDPNEGSIEIGSNMTIWGTGVIRVIPGSGVFNYVLGAVPQDAPISNVTIRGITIDENVLNNPGLVGPAENRYENILTAYRLTHLLVDGATFYVSGPYALRIQDFITVQNSKFYFEQRPEQKHYDNSAILLSHDHGTCSITNNTFQGITKGAGQAVEVHYTSNCVISGNTFDNYATAILPEDNYNVGISNNTITRAMVAISIWAQLGVKGVTITNNNISINNRDRQSISGAGIMFQYCDYCEPMGNFQNVEITNNVITYQMDSRTNICVSCFWGIGLQTTGNIDAVTISGNTIVNAPIRGIQIGSAFTSSVVSNVLVENNTIVTPGCNTDEMPSDAGISLAGAVRDVTISGNIIKNESQPFAGHYGLYSDSGGKYENVTVSNNTVQKVYKNQLSSSIDYHN